MAAKSRRASKLEKIREAAFIVVADVLIDRLVGSDVYSVKKAATDGTTRIARQV